MLEQSSIFPPAAVRRRAVDGHASVRERRDRDNFMLMTFGVDRRLHTESSAN